MTETDLRTEADFERAKDIMQTDDPVELVRKVFEYYVDTDRADRTPRATLYLHVGLLCGAFLRDRESREVS